MSIPFLATHTHTRTHTLLSVPQKEAGFKWTTLKQHCVYPQDRKSHTGGSRACLHFEAASGRAALCITKSHSHRDFTTSIWQHTGWGRGREHTHKHTLWDMYELFTEMSIGHTHVHTSTHTHIHGLIEKKLKMCGWTDGWMTEWMGGWGKQPQSAHWAPVRSVFEFLPSTGLCISCSVCYAQAQLKMYYSQKIAT